MTGPVVITGGGTGGHIFPMRAIADALSDAGVSDADVRYVGSRRGQEAALLGGGTIPLTLLPGRGIRRSLSPRAVRDNVGALLALAGAFVVALGYVRRYRPRVVVSVGGYAAAAVSAAALVWRRPLVLVDLDATPSATHRLLARFAASRCVALGQPAAGVVVSGAPVRADLVGLDRSSDERRRAKTRMSPPIEPQRRVVVVMSGSLGATSVNRAVIDLARRWHARSDVTLVHVTGRRDYAWVTSQRPEVAGLDYRVIEFADMTQWWAVADLAICRAGALTIAEVTVLALPAILVPLPGSPGDHQGFNARALAEAGAAIVVRDSACTGETLERHADALLDPEAWQTMSEASARLARPDAAETIAREVLRVGGAW